LDCIVSDYMGILSVCSDAMNVVINWVNGDGTLRHLIGRGCPIRLDTSPSTELIKTGRAYCEVVIVLSRLIPCQPIVCP